jgi:hypothetical protein
VLRALSRASSTSFSRTRFAAAANTNKNVNKFVNNIHNNANRNKMSQVADSGSDLIVDDVEDMVVEDCDEGSRKKRSTVEVEMERGLFRGSSKVEMEMGLFRGSSKKGVF